MHRSSESIACLTAALAKAQAELTNAEKSLVATIRQMAPGSCGIRGLGHLHYVQMTVRARAPRRGNLPFIARRRSRSSDAA
jgi:hypothetical protein